MVANVCPAAANLEAVVLVLVVLTGVLGVGVRVGCEVGVIWAVGEVGGRLLSEDIVPPGWLVGWLGRCRDSSGVGGVFGNNAVVDNSDDDGVKCLLVFASVLVDNTLDLLLLTRNELFKAGSVTVCS